MIGAKIVCDSIGSHGIRLTTMEVTIPRFLLAQFNTHRAFSRNSASSRAVPTEKMIQRVEENPFVPSVFGSNQRGMQAGDNLPPAESHRAEGIWQSAMRTAVIYAKQLADCGVHKQLANRLLEPFAYTTVLVTATDWDNFFKPRIHHAAQPEMQEVAQAMHRAMDEGDGLKMLKPGDWHIPYGDRMPLDLTPAERVKVAVARCARLSYMTHDGTRDVAKDLELYQRLYDERHMSPFEHVAQCLPAYASEARYYNLRRWMSYRYQIENYIDT